jgi:hypothetical protein
MRGNRKLRVILILEVKLKVGELKNGGKIRSNGNI